MESRRVLIPSRYFQGDKLNLLIRLLCDTFLPGWVHPQIFRLRFNGLPLKF